MLSVGDTARQRRPCNRPIAGGTFPVFFARCRKTVGELFGVVLCVGFHGCDLFGWPHMGAARRGLRNEPVLFNRIQRVVVPLRLVSLGNGTAVCPVAGVSAKLGRFVLQSRWNWPGLADGVGNDHG